MSLLTASLLELFIEFPFMRRALVATLALSLGCAPIGCVLVLRRMSLAGDAMAHAVLPGAAAGFLLAGLSLPAMSLGGFVAALAVAHRNFKRPRGRAGDAQPVWRAWNWRN